MINQRQKNRTTKRNLVIFTATILTIGWFGHGLDVLLDRTGPESPGTLLWLVTPLVVTLLLRIFGGDGWKDFGVKLNIKRNVPWYVVAILVYPVLTALVLIVGATTGPIVFPDSSSNTVRLILRTFAAGFPALFVKNIFEETAWRGYLAPKIFSLRVNDFLGHFIVGIIWGAWHIPYYLFFLDRTVLTSFTTLDLTVFVLFSIAAMITWAVVYGEIRFLTGSIWPVVLMHTVENALVNPLFTEHYIRISPGTDWLISPMNGLISIAIFLAIGIVLNRWRKRKGLS